ncbi:TIR domain-containing protein [Nocardia aurantia]|uniref:TIR domain-containing protein n=1 Tax=Nocardia aurantia TaxID=2585199 RepID=UPI001885D6D8|nr:nucleotide-binding protein [Nocardia aurantia]
MFFGDVPSTLSGKVADLRKDFKRYIRKLTETQEQLPLFDELPEASKTVPSKTIPSAVGGYQVFIVHGHDELAKESVARFLHDLLGRPPVILHEQADLGRTIIEKFEAHAAQAAAAIVLLTADDKGAAKDAVDLNARARQNVILELGFFIGTLGRARTIILHDPGVELPSDLLGVIYIRRDPERNWRSRVAKELREGAKLNCNMDALTR